MTQLRTSLALLGTAAVLAACGSATEPRLLASDPLLKSDNAPAHLVSGGGTVDVTLGRSTYAFHASMNGAGAVSGSFELHFTSVDANVHGTITCLVVDGNTAWLGGVTTRSSDESLVPVGREFDWVAQDNGEGANAAADRISGFRVGSAARCLLMQDFLARDWTNGNVLVR